MGREAASEPVVAAIEGYWWACWWAVEEVYRAGLLKARVLEQVVALDAAASNPGEVGECEGTGVVVVLGDPDTETFEFCMV